MTLSVPEKQKKQFIAVVSAPVWSGTVGGSSFFVLSSDSFSFCFSSVTCSELTSFPTTGGLLIEDELGWLAEEPSPISVEPFDSSSCCCSDSETNGKKV